MTTTPRLRPWSAFLVIGRVAVVSLLAAAMVLGQSLGSGNAVAERRGDTTWVRADLASPL